MTNIRMKSSRSISLISAILFLLSLSINAVSQTPNIYAQVGYPVGSSSNATSYGNSVYLVLGGYSNNSNRIYSSSNATTWNLVMTSGLAAKQFNAMAFGASLFVIVGQDGTIQSSSDGITWTTRTSGTVNHLYRVYFYNSKFFAIGTNRTLLSSTDGISWTTITFSVGVATDNFFSLSYGNGVYVIAARNTGGSYAYAYRSTTAANNSWSVKGYDYFNYESVNRVEFLNNKFWMFTIGQVMYTSSDGSTWSNITPSVVVTNPDLSTASFGNGNQIFNAVWDGTKYYFYGCSQYWLGYGSTFVSTNGTAWTLLPKSAYIVPQESEIVNGIFFVNGNEGFVTSTDGLTYAHSGASFSDVVKTTNKYVAAGYVGNDGVLYNSTDFFNWTCRSAIGTAQVMSIATDGSTILAGGFYKVYKSTDEGDSWSTAYTSNIQESFYAMAYGNGRFVGAGYDGNGSFIRYSTNNGTSWITANTDAISLIKIKYVNGYFFGMGTNNTNYQGLLYFSADGITWTDITPTTAFIAGYYKDVVYDGSAYHVLGVEFVYDNGLEYNVPSQFFTLSTNTPQTAASWGNKATCNNTPVGAKLGGDYDQGTLSYDGTKFIGGVTDVSTGRDYIIYSTNGSSWTAVPQDGYSAFVSSILVGAKVRILGRGNSFYTASFSALPVNWGSFTGQWQGANAILKWTTIEEKNCERYEVEYSKDGRTFDKIGIVKAKGNSDTKTDYLYSFLPSGSSHYYFRIRQIDLDGNSTFSTVVTLQQLKTGIASVYPNPAENGKINLRLANATNVILLSPEGKVIFNGRLNEGNHQFNVDGKSKGIYMLRAGTEILRVIVK